MTLASELGRTRAGGKAATLMQLRDAGYRVPVFEVSPEDVADCVRRLGFPLVVRSSATVEDGAACSFAGQFASYLHLTNMEQVEAAISDCRESLRSPGVADYCRRAGIDVNNIVMHVIVQRMIEPEIAGVAFSVDPMSGDSHVVIEACEGTGEALLAGRANALDEDDRRIVQFRPQIEELARSVHKHFGCPQDIEFAVGQGEVWLLQARPITRIQFAAETGEWTNADFRDGGVSSSVCSPLMWSLYQRIWNDSLKKTLNAIHLRGDDFEAGKMFFGRPYWNVGAVKARVAKIPGYVERDFDEDLGMETTYQGDGYRQLATPGNLIRAIPIVWGVSQFLRKQLRVAEQYVQAGISPIDRAGKLAIADCESGFARLVDHDFARLETAYFQTIFALSLAKLDFRLSFPAADFGELVKGLPALSHMAPSQWIQEHIGNDAWNDSSWQESFKHHCRFGVDLIHPRWDEDEQFVRLMREQLASTVQREPSEFQGHELPAELRQGRGHRKLQRLRRLIWLREELRNLSNRMYYYLRRCAVEIGQRRFIGDDVFFMTYREVIADERGNIEQARWVYEAFRNFQAPNEIGCRFNGSRSGVVSGGRWQGLAASRGVAHGLARVAHTVEQAMAVEPGAILICPFTEPGWTPALSRVAAVVTESGGLLSHAAVICREYGLPAVLAVPHATKEIVDGALVEVNGVTGMVTLQER